MKLVLISDTHTMHNQVAMPFGDILIHAGDFTYTGARHEYEDVIEWLKGQSHCFSHIVLIAGNHDFGSRIFLEGIAPNVHYLENSGIAINGIKFWGSPITPTFGRWAHMAMRGAMIRAYWNTIPNDTDVLITHGPPVGILDLPSSASSFRLGCEELHDIIFDVVKPKLHAFGHIHGGYGRVNYKGINFYNASIVDESYKVVNTPWIAEI